MLKTVVIGAINWDINFFVGRFPQKGEEVVVKKITRVPGGKAGNVSVAAARLLGPDRVAIIGALGRDLIADEHVKIFQSEGVIVSGLKFNPEVESGQAYIVIDEHGENVIHTYFGANATMMTPEDLESPERSKLISEASVITIMDPPFNTAVKLATMGRKSGKIVAWDPGVKSELGIDKARPLLENANYVVANESETENLVGIRNQPLAAEKLGKINPSLKFVAKLGAKGSILYHAGKQTVAEAVDLESRGFRIVNTVGCGDAFIGAFVAALSEGVPDAEALKWANCAGGLKATRAETRGSPDRQTLMKHLS